MEKVFRTIMIFPAFKNISIIDDIRNRFDPLCEKVRPHITLVFPFESTRSHDEIYHYLDNILNDVRAFELKLQGVSRAGCWIHLNVKSGQKELQMIHEKLYLQEFVQYKPFWLEKYIPHLTIGQFETESEAERA